MKFRAYYNYELEYLMFVDINAVSDSIKLLIRIIADIKQNKIKTLHLVSEAIWKTYLKRTIQRVQRRLIKTNSKTSTKIETIRTTKTKTAPKRRIKANSRISRKNMSQQEKKTNWNKYSTINKKLDKF